MFLNVVEFGMNAEAAVEAPRYPDPAPDFELRQSCLESGRPAARRAHPGRQRMAELAERGHKVGTRSRWASGAAPVMIRVLPDGVIEAGADPYGYRVARAY